MGRGLGFTSTHRRQLGLAVAIALLALVAQPTAAGGPRRPVLTLASVTAAPLALPARPAPDLRFRLEALLGQHTFLVDRLVRARLRNDPDVAQAANLALTSNTADLARLLGSVYGSQATDTFTALWPRHVAQVLAYASAVAAHDSAGQRLARESLTLYEDDLATALSRLTHGRAPAATVRSALEMHVTDLLAQADAYARGDYATAFAKEREGYEHMFAIGSLLAAAIASDTSTAAATGPLADLRSRLGMLLGEHVELAVDVTRSGLQGLPDFSAQTAVLDTNSQAIAGAIGTVFGAGAARQFLAQWADHVDALVDYSTATTRGDDAARQRDADRMRRFALQFADFLSGATASRLSRQVLAETFQQHDEYLMTQVDDYHAKDYSAAYNVSYAAYRQMFDVAPSAAAAIAATVAAHAPRGGAQTGFGWAARHHVVP